MESKKSHPFNLLTKALLALVLVGCEYGKEQILNYMQNLHYILY